MRLHKYRRGVVAHVYQRSQNGRILFYSYKDCLLFFTIFCVVAKRHGVKIIALCLMPDHIHFLVVAESHLQLATFVDVYSSLFAREFNISLGRFCHVFRSPYGMANKPKEKAQRTSVIYVLNNPVEKKLTRRMERWRWNFFEYSSSANPFSEPLVVSKASNKLRRSLKMAKYMASSGTYLSASKLDSLFGCLDARETEQLVDYVVTAYNVIDYDFLYSLFPSLEALRLAAHSSTGSEYDLHEDFDPSSDAAYAKIACFVSERKPLRNARDVVTLPADDKMLLMNELFALGVATARQLRKYFQFDEP